MAIVFVLGAVRSGVLAASQGIAEAAGVNLTCAYNGSNYGLLGNDDGNSQPAIGHSAVIDADNRHWLCENNGISERMASFFTAQPNEEKMNVLVQAQDTSLECPNMKFAHAVLTLYPDARAVVVWRIGVDFVNSCLRAFPGKDFVAHCLLWKNSIAQMQRLAEDFGARVQLVECSQIRSRPKEVADRLAKFLSEWDLDEMAILRQFSRNLHENNAIFGERPIADPARTGWSMAEVEVFRSLCNAALSAIGDSFDIASAERRRPIDIAEAMLRRGKGVGGVQISASPQRGGAPVLSYGGASLTEGSAIRLSAVAAGGRRKLRLRFALQAAGEAGEHEELRCEIVESVSRRAVFVRSFDLGEGQEALVDQTLPEHVGLLDFFFSRQGRIAGRGFSVNIFTATLGHA